MQTNTDQESGLAQFSETCSLHLGVAGLRVYAGRGGLLGKLQSMDHCCMTYTANTALAFFVQLEASGGTFQWTGCLCKSPAATKTPEVANISASFDCS